MRKYFLGLLLVGTVTSLVVSCDKAKENVQPNEAVQVNATTLGRPKAPPQSSLRTLYTSPDFHCDPPSVNCLDDVVIHGRLLTSVSQAATAGPSGVAAFFKTEEAEALGLDDERMIKLQSGNFGLKEMVDGQGSFHYFGAFEQSNSNVFDFVLPLKEE